MKLLIIAMLISTGVYGQSQIVGVTKPKSKYDSLNIYKPPTYNWVIGQPKDNGAKITFHSESRYPIICVHGYDAEKDSITIHGDTMQAIRKLLKYIATPRFYNNKISE